MVYELSGIENGQHLRLKTTVTEEHGEVPTVTGVWRTADWHEREAYDMMGVKFAGHPNLKRILMWEGYPYFPLRKDFPLTGHTEVRYDDLEKKVIYEPVKLTQEFRNFDSESPWEGMENKLFGDEKSTGEN